MSWEMVPFIKVCNIQGGTQPPKSMFLEEEQEGYIRLLQIQDFKRSDKAVFVPDRKTLKKCNEDDILIGRYGASVGKILTGLKGAYNVALVKTVPNLKKLNKKYLYHFLRSPCFQNYILNVGSRAAQAGFNKDDLAGLQIPLPPLPEQQRIADILDKAEAINQKREQALALCDEFLRATFLDMFGDPVSNPKGWEVKTLDKVCKIRRGASPRPIKNYIGGSIPWIKIGDATKGDEFYITSTKEKVTEEGAGKSVFLKAGSLIFANCGVSLGFARVLKIDGCIHDGWLSLYDFNKEVDVFFLLKWINFQTDYFRAIAPEGTQPNLNTSIMKNQKIFLPPIELQQQFTNIVEKVNAIKARILQAQELPLFDALSQQAFKGELTQ